MTKRPLLFDPLPGAGPEIPVVLGGPRETLRSLAEGFWQAADALAGTCRSARDDGGDAVLAIPVLQTYRHALELLLKAQCLEAQRVLRAGLTDGFGTDTAVADLEGRIGATHSIARIVGLLTRILSGLDVSDAARRIPADIESTLRFLQDVDSDGTAFRYATRKVPDTQPARWVPVRPAEMSVYLDSAVTRLVDALQLLSVGLDEFLAVQEQILTDLRVEFAEGE